MKDRIDLIEDNNIDDQVDFELNNCLDINNLRSFFLFAGAGSGKTRSLVNVLQKFQQKHSKQLQLNGQKIAIITYTNSACEEIERRLKYNPIFFVSTIHSFIWELIRDFNIDIKDWFHNNLRLKIKELELEQVKGRAGTKAYFERERSIEIKYRLIQKLKEIKKFTYNPNGLNQEKGSLSHSEVISAGAYFLTNKQLMQKILTKKFPILLIDESQDTNKELMNAFLEVEKNTNCDFCLGLFGDTMQRIYSDGKVDLGVKLPETWATPVKKMNHRCPPRIVKLINKIRASVDGQEQRGRNDKSVGFVRLFILPVTANKASVEELVLKRMAEITGDPKWSGDNSEYTTLILEHHMAAKRLGFLEMFQPLYKQDKLRTGLLDGSLSELKLFTQIILPIIKANEIEDKLTITKIVGKYSPLFKKNENVQLSHIKKGQEAIKQLLSLWNDNKDPRCIDVLNFIKKTELFELPDCLLPFITIENDEHVIKEESLVESKEATNEWHEFLNAPFSQIMAYNAYITGKFKYMTHQGVKGLEFPRVAVIIDDSEARGFLFSYEKLFGAKEKSKVDVKNESEGKDTSINRTRRLFYVTCSRAEESLAIIAYSTNPELVKNHVLDEEWFENSEIEIITTT